VPNGEGKIEVIGMEADISTETVLSVIFGGLITMAVSWIFNYLSSKKLEKVAGGLHHQTDLLKAENSKLRSVSKGIVMALEKPGEFEPKWNEDGSFAGWHHTQRLYTSAVFVDERGTPIRDSRLKSWWRRFLTRN
jgi:hypothetical protein